MEKHRRPWNAALVTFCALSLLAVPRGRPAGAQPPETVVAPNVSVAVLTSEYLPQI